MIFPVLFAIKRDPYLAVLLVPCNLKSPEIDSQLVNWKPPFYNSVLLARNYELPFSI